MSATRALPRLAGALLAAGAIALPAAAASAGPLTTAAGTGPCTDPTGVTVVVDATELGGEVAVGCADAPATGTDALTQAGFTESRDPSGYICAVGGLPDPCPTEFTGSYWTYWNATDGEWTTWMEGSDTAVPAAGSVEGWRYGDGTVPPDVDLAAVTPGASGDAAAAPADEQTEEPSTEAPADEPTLTARATTEDPGDSGDGSGLPIGVGVAVGAAIVAAVVAVLVRLRRQAAEQQQD
jgi:hypothetical protein